MSYKVKPYRTGPGSGERWFGVFDDDGKRIAGGWQDGNSFDGLGAEQAANRWLTNMGEEKNELIYTQTQLDAAIAKAVRERTRECYEIARIHIAPALTIQTSYPDCFEEDTP